MSILKSDLMNTSASFNGHRAERKKGQPSAWVRGTRVPTQLYVKEPPHDPPSLYLNEGNKQRGWIEVLHA